MSKETNNPIESLLKMEFHYVMTIYRNLEKLQKEQEKERKKQEGTSTPAGYKMPPGMQSMMNSVKGMQSSGIPNMSSGSFKVPRI